MRFGRVATRARAKELQKGPETLSTPSKRLALARVATFADSRLLRTVMGNSVSTNSRFDLFGKRRWSQRPR